MKKFLVIVLSSILFLVWTPAFAGNKDRQRNKKNNQHQVQRHKKQQGKRYYNQRHPDRRDHYRRDRRSHHKKRLHKYQGHYKWNRWHQERRRPRYRNGQYNIDRNGFLRFSYCNGGTCFSISLD